MKAPLLPLLTACLAALAAIGPAFAESPSSSVPVPAPGSAAPPTHSGNAGAAKEGAGTPDPRDRQIDDLRRIIESLQRRVEELERRPSPAPSLPPAPTPEAPPAPLPPPAEAPAPAPAPPAGSDAGATFLPNISAVGNLVLGGGDTRRVPNRGRFNFDEFELAFQDAVAPKLRYDVFLSAEKGESWKLGMEEGYLTASALYPGLNVRAGQIRVPFGKFNPLHTHVWPFITQPSAESALLGPGGLTGDGAVVEYLLPVKGLFARGELGAWQTTSEPEHGLGFAAGDLGAYSGRLWLGKELGRDRELELGVSRYQGRGEVPGFGRRARALNGLDLTFRSYPGGYRRFKLAAELIDHETSLPNDTAHRLGGFAYATYRMDQFWEAGARGDYTRFAYPVTSYDWGGSLFLTRYLTEVTSLRLEYQYARSPRLGSGSGIFFQVLFGSGPHTHQLQ